MALLSSVQSNLCVDHVNKIKVDGLDNLVARLLQVARTTHHNLRTRRQLARLSDHALKDVGLTKADAYEELNKPLWR